MDQQEQQKFSIQLYSGLAEILHDDAEKFQQYEIFIQFCREATKIFIEMGGILKQAFEDITAKCNIIERNYNMHPELKIGLIDFIKFEIDQNIHKYYGEHSKLSKNDKYYNYESTARTTLRLMWFLDFVHKLLDQLVNEKNRLLASICQTAYNDALGSHHPFTLRMAVKAGLLTVGTRDSLMKILFKNEYTPEQQDEILIILVAKLNKLKSSLWTFFKQNNLCDLP